MLTRPVGEVDINIGGTHPFKVEEPLEQTVVIHRVETNHPEGIQHETAGGGAARGERVSLLVRVVDVIPHNEEIAGVAGLLDDVEFVVQPLAYLFGEMSAIFLAQPFVAEFLEIGIVCVSLRHLIRRHQALSVIEFEVAPIGDFHRVANRLRRKILQHLAHFVNALEVEVVFKAQSVCVVDGFLCLDTEQDIVHAMVGLPEVVAVVRAYDGQVILLRQLHHYRIGGKFVIDVVILHLNVEIPLTHNLL